MAPRRTKAPPAEPTRRSGRLIAQAAERAANARRPTIVINPALQQRREAAARAAAATLAQSPSPQRPDPAPAPAPVTAATAPEADADDSELSELSEPPTTPTPAPTQAPVTPQEWLTFRERYRTIQYGPRGEREERRLKCVITVLPPPRGIYSRLKYLATFFLRTNDGDWERVANISAFRIDKTTLNAPNAENSWLGDFLTKPNINSVNDERNGREVAKLLRACFKVDGVAKRAVRAYRDEMTEQGVMVVDVVYVLDGYEGMGLMRPMLQMFRSGLQRLPEWFVFRDVLILSPGRFAGDMGDRWGDMSDDDVANTLRGMYERIDDYEWCGDLSAWGETMIIMARMVE